MSSADGDWLNSFVRLDESRALEHLAGRCRRGALGRREDAQVDEPGTCDVLSVSGSFVMVLRANATYRS